MDINWLSGGPYYEVSIIIANKYKNETELNNLINNFNLLQYKIELFENNLGSKIWSFCNKDICQIDLNIFINICGNQRSKIYIEYLSDEIIQICFCFLEEKINKGKMNRLRNLLKDLLKLYNGIVGMIGWETVCNLALFDTKNAYPHKDYSIKRIKHLTNKDLKNNQGWYNGIEEIIWNHE